MWLESVTTHIYVYLHCVLRCAGPFSGVCFLHVMCTGIIWIISSFVSVSTWKLVS